MTTNLVVTYVLINCASLSPFHFILRLASFSPADRQFSHQLSRWDQVLVQTTWHRVQHWLWGSRGLWCLGVWFASGFSKQSIFARKEFKSSIKGNKRQHPDQNGLWTNMSAWDLLLLPWLRWTCHRCSWKRSRSTLRLWRGLAKSSIEWKGS